MFTRMLRGTGILAFLAVLVVVSTGIASGGVNAGKELRPGCETETTFQGFKPWAKGVWDPKRWHRDSLKDKTIKAYKQKLKCAQSKSHKSAMSDYWRGAKSDFRDHQEKQYDIRQLRLEIVAVTPYSCGSAGRYAIPCYIVACESGYSWSAYNPSGAAGVYQIMAEHGRPWPVYSARDKLVHHQIAYSLYSGGSGASNWVCA